MNGHLITEILAIEAEADKIVDDAKRRAGEIVAGIHGEVERIQSSIEDEYRRKLEALKTQLAMQQAAEAERQRNRYELLKKNLLQENGKNKETAVGWTIKHLFGH